jgi:dye decolorizing peroxidase
MSTRASLVRRDFLRLGGVAGGGIALGAAGGVAGVRAVDGHDDVTADVSAAAAGNERLAFYGAHQPGIDAPTQAQATLVAFDLAPALRQQGPDMARRELVSLSRAWSDIAARAMAGEPLPADDAMAYGRGPASLTMTIGFGASLLRAIGLSHQVPDALAPIPAFLGDALDATASDGDLGVLVAGNDGLVITHALRALQRVAHGTLRQRWQLSGFADSPGALPTPSATPRNLMGQLDGTGNPARHTTAFERAVFVPVDGTPAWMRGGSYLVARRIRMLLDDWDTLSRPEQEAVIGRRKDNGAPLSGGTEFTPANYDALTASGGLAIPAGAHIRQARPAANQGATILRRGFNYYEGTLADGSPNAGLMFLAFQADPRTGFVPIQQRLAGADSLSTFIRHEASALFALPGGRPGGYLGQDLLEGT